MAIRYLLNAFSGKYLASQKANSRTIETKPPIEKTFSDDEILIHSVNVPLLKANIIDFINNHDAVIASRKPTYTGHEIFNPQTGVTTRKILRGEFGIVFERTNDVGEIQKTVITIPSHYLEDGLKGKVLISCENEHYPLELQKKLLHHSQELYSHFEIKLDPDCIEKLVKLIEPAIEKRIELNVINSALKDRQRAYERAIPFMKPFLAARNYTLRTFVPWLDSLICFRTDSTENPKSFYESTDNPYRQTNSTSNSPLVSSSNIFSISSNGQNRFERIIDFSGFGSSDDRITVLEHNKSVYLDMLNEILTGTHSAEYQPNIHSLYSDRSITHRSGVIYLSNSYQALKIIIPPFALSGGWQGDLVIKMLNCSPIPPRAMVLTSFTRDLVNQDDVKTNHDFSTTMCVEGYILNKLKAVIDKAIS